jgi:hypothetical protein
MSEIKNKPVTIFFSCVPILLFAITLISFGSRNLVSASGGWLIKKRQNTISCTPDIPAGIGRGLIQSHENSGLADSQQNKGAENKENNNGCNHQLLTSELCRVRKPQQESGEDDTC